MPQNIFITHTEIQKLAPDSYKGFYAYPILYGNENSTLGNFNLKNGDFEDRINNTSGWKQIGDVRQINKLGNLLPISGESMIMLSTSIGSA